MQRKNLKNPAGNFKQLPPEVTREITNKLDLESLGNLESTSKFFQKFLENQDVTINIPQTDGTSITVVRKYPEFKKALPTITNLTKKIDRLQQNIGNYGVKQRPQNLQEVEGLILETNAIFWNSVIKVAQRTIAIEVALIILNTCFNNNKEYLNISPRGIYAYGNLAGVTVGACVGAYSFFKRTHTEIRAMLNHYKNSALNEEAAALATQLKKKP